ncbi:dihydroneopterin aldolase [Ferrimicrobium acidiphilum]|uniref:Putative dihydroneopterin aldolase n=1 Tax=Ferrimicrobium acidiphilum DSM 19497 TaxID=1121877 RepID=A0A0D8FUL9_9ACTN|nr:dihydroneopterin aldolase [Ferrimicrobium acidiphilum]KJE76983.1 putative dihydroneopterin aldolase [Ferrimicrobium acidiphilum DSM 19497]
MSDVIEIARIELMTHVGLTEAERSTPQPIVIGIRLILDIERGQRDYLGATFDYAVIDRVIPTALMPAPRLLETLAERIIDGIVRDADCTRVDTIEVSVTKCKPPLELICDGVTVTLATQLRDDSAAAQS